MSYRKTKLDANHGMIVTHLRKHSVEVIDLSAAGKLPDLLCGYRGWWAFVECKIEGSAAKWTRLQLATIAGTTMPVIIAKSPDEAFTAIRDKRCLSVTQKGNITALLLRKPKDFYTPGEVEAILKPMPPPDQMRMEETEYYSCDNCGEMILSRLPRGLVGLFIHAWCHRSEYEKYSDTRSELGSKLSAPGPASGHRGPSIRG